MGVKVSISTMRCYKKTRKHDKSVFSVVDEIDESVTKTVFVQGCMWSGEGWHTTNGRKTYELKKVRGRRA